MLACSAGVCEIWSVGLSSTESVELARDVEVKSPCNGICTLDAQDVCRGCKRTRSHISNWYVMSNDEKREVMLQIVGSYQ
jgi:predicted Fe-S protein YdhL (DUF1289 family)